MNEVTAAVALAQVERMGDLVERRQEVAKYFIKAVEGCDWITPQYVPDGYTNTFWTFATLYTGEEKIGISWKHFYNKFKEIGGHGFYGGHSVVYEEPVIKDLTFIKSGYIPSSGPCSYSHEYNYDNAMCPVAERIQPQIMSFKTNYRDINEAKEQASILKKLINQLSIK